MNKKNERFKTEVRGTNIKNLSTEDMLKLALDMDIIDMASVEEKIEMKQRSRILKQHPYSIWEGKNGYWYTYFQPDEGCKRKLVKKKTQKDLEDMIVKLYCGTDEKHNITFGEMYYKWREMQDKLVSDNTISKYDTDYQRYFANQAFTNLEIERITEETVKVFICKTVKEQTLCKKACKTLFGYVKNVIKSALINKVLYENPIEYLEAKQFYKYCTEKKKSPEQRVVSDFDMKRLYERFQKDYDQKPDYIPTYAVELATLTGMRVGELSALKWEDIHETYIFISKSEKYNRIEKKYYIDQTKNKENRKFPISEEIRNLLDRVKKAEIRSGYVCEWVFANQNGRIHAPVISSCLKNKCRQIGMEEKGIHAFRRTVNSKMRCSGVPATVAASLLGHTEEVNENYYTYDVSSFAEKQRIVEQINRSVVGK